MEQQNQQPRPFKVALDIGTTKVVAVAGRKNAHGKIEIVGYSSLFNTGVQQGEIFNLFSVKDAIEHVMEDMKKKFDIDIEEVSVGLSGDHIKVMTVTENILRDNHKEIITEKDLIELITKTKNSILKENHEEVIAVYPQYYSVDQYYKVKQPVGMTGYRLEGTFVIVKADLRKIQKIEESLDLAQLKIDEIFLQSVASAEAVLNSRQKEAGCMLVDIGGGTSDVLIIKEGIIRYTDVIPYGGDAITADIENKFSLLPKEAEHIKKEFGTAYSKSFSDNLILEIDTGWNRKRQISRRQLSAVIEQKLEYISNFFREILWKYQRRFPAENLMAGMVLTGGGSQIKDIKQFMEMKMGMDVEIGSPNTHLASGKFSSELSGSKYATVIGLLKLALEESEHMNNSELNTPEDYYSMTRAGRNEETNESPADLFSQEGMMYEEDDLQENEKKTNKGILDKLIKTFGKLAYENK